MIILKFHVDWWSGSREIIFFKIFSQSNMAAIPCDINYLWIPWYPQVLGIIFVKFPLSSRFGDLYRFSGKSNKAAKPCDLWHHMCERFVPRDYIAWLCLVGPLVNGTSFPLERQLDFWDCSESCWKKLKGCSSSSRLELASTNSQRVKLDEKDKWSLCSIEESS